MSKVAKLKVVETDDFVMDEIPYAVPDREWEMKYVGHETKLMFGRAGKLQVRFEIIEQGEFLGAQLCAWYNVELIGPPRKMGRFKPSRGGDFIRDYAAICGRIRRGDRLSLRHYESKIILGTTRTVTKNSKQQDLGNASYSVIGHLRCHPDHQANSEEDFS